MSTIVISPAAAALHPQLADIRAAAATAGSPQFIVVAAGEAGGDVVVGRGSVPTIRRCVASRRLQLCFAPEDAVFAAALILAAARGDAIPAGNDPQSVALLGLATKVASRDVTVLIAGPTGTGKEGLARFVHSRSSRRAGSFVAINCAAIPDTMLEATLFGYERGAFTGATTSAPGLFRAAAGGTLLLDEVSELPLAMQAKLLRALQEREVLPVGATSPISIDARIVATTNRNLAADVREDRFRSDPFYRIAVFPLMTSALAERRRDIIPVTATLWLRQQIATWPTPAALAKLTAYSWPGNVRELGNVIARAAVFADEQIDVDDILFDALPDVPARSSLSIGIRAHEFATIRTTLAACSGRRSEAAVRLGIGERTLRYKLAAMAPATLQ